MALSTQDLQLAEGLRGRGLKSPKATIAEARRAGLPLSYALAFLEKESSGTDTDGTARFGLNLFGHDAVRNPVKGGFVTQARYVQYRTNRQAGLGMQGVGPLQLTWYEFQDRADGLGGCWMPKYNMRVGFAIAKALIRQYGLQAGVARWNGTGGAAQAYASDWLGRQRRWQAALAELGATEAAATNGSGRVAAGPGAPRCLHLASPHMTGPDVRALQLKLGVDADGDYGPITDRAVRASKRLMGFEPKNWGTGATVRYVDFLFGRKPVPDDFAARAAAVKAADAAKAAAEAKAGGSRVEAANWLIERANRHESPVQNRAKWLDKWQIANGHPGYSSPGEEGWPWCGIACWAAYKWGAGVPLDGRMRSTDWIYVAASANTDRLQRIPLAQGKKGDLVLLFARGEHVGMLAADYAGGMLSTIEGNTSPGSGGGLAAQANGGGIYAKTRGPGDVVMIVRVN